MTRHTENLARLHNKMCARYGVNDLMVQDVKRELDNLSCANAAAATLARDRPATPPSSRAGCQLHRWHDAASVMSAN